MNSSKSITGTAADRQTFTKAERLCSTKLISEIFENGNVLYTSLFRIIWIPCPTELKQEAQVAISVPKKLFKSAVTRNLIKRRFREAYRREKYMLYHCLKEEGIKIAFIIIMRQMTVPDYQVMEKSVREVIKMLCGRIRHREIKD